ncbi:MAG TPA: carboxyl transferase domain-containing protein [Usitatibacter sp.]|nr:carboxyl transferase domain-containing protein [Usitatibacter sp.]
MSNPAALLEALKKAVAFEPHKDRVGNLAWGKGTLDGKPVRLALVENRFASGSIGEAEAERLGALFKIAAREKAPMILHLDSAGAKISEGLKALGAFRAVYRAGLEAVESGARMAAVLGANCFGGSSMLAHLAPRRLFSPQTKLAMSGPAILAAAAGMDALDEAFRAMADATLVAGARAKASPANVVWGPGMDVGAWLREAFADATDARTRHGALLARIAKEPVPMPETVQRWDLERLYEGDYEAKEADGVLFGHGKRAGAEEAIIGLVGHRPVGAARAWRFAELAWKLVDKAPARVEVYLDCASHAPKLEDERIVLSEFIAGMSRPLAALRLKGAHVGLTVLTQAGGGVYVALAGPASRVVSVHEADIQVLPGAAVAAILGGENIDAAPSFDAYREAGVAEEELKIGLVKGHA